ncbi:hypothetical protein AX16_009473 [Volvariella volvacea WC 439]|nr:hypothetical protein AX16_009473 [Volvariella volvacea WC 439]
MLSAWVTGVTGFIAGHIALQLLEQGYRVRGTIRGAKVNKLKETIKLPGLEFVQINDVATGDFTEALKDVEAIVHVASPLPGKASADDTLNSAIDGTLNIVKQAEALGIYKVVVTSSYVSVLEPSFQPAFQGIELSDSDWGEVTRSQVLERADDAYYVYFASKLLAERALWDYLKDHPKFDVATILPVYVFGPFAEPFPFPTPAALALGTNGYIWNIINSRVPHQGPPFFVDVRDVAKAHVRALSVPPSPTPEAKRFMVNAGKYTWKQATQYINRTRPEIKTPTLEAFGEFPGPLSTLVTTRAKEVLGLDKYVEFEKTIDDAIESLYAASKTWA